MNRLRSALTLMLTTGLLSSLVGCDLNETPEGKALKQVPIPEFESIQDTKIKKHTFFEYLAPMVNLANQEIELERSKLAALVQQPEAMKGSDKRWIKSLCKSYKAKCEDSKSPKAAAITLIDRLGSVPPSMALAQAANESAWGTSRFAIDGHNYFGQWCYTEDCGIVPAKRSKNATHEVRVFDHPLDSVRSYVHNINTSPAYEHLRQLRLVSRKNNQPLSGRKLAAGLIKYSERREAYVKEIRHMIKGNNLEQYDNLLNQTLVKGE